MPVQHNMAAAKFRIYLVEDHPTVRRGFQVLINLQPDMETCGEADAAAAGLEGIMAHRPDLAVVDLSLKEGSGLELILELRLHCPEVKILVVSMHDQPSYVERALGAGAKGYLAKDEGTDKLIEAIRRVLRGQLYLSEWAAAKLSRQAPGAGADRARTSVESLTDEEREVLEMIGRGLGEREISRRLRVPRKAVDTYRLHIRKKLGLLDPSELSIYAAGWVQRHTGA